MPTALRTVLDARLPDGAYGGVQQWIIGLAEAFSSLAAGEEEYIFLVDPGHGAWLKPFVSGPCSIREAVTDRRSGRLASGLRSRVADLPGARAAWRAARSLSPRPPSLPVSDGTIEGLEADVVHFTFQDAFVTDVPSLYQPWDLQHRHLPQFFPPSERRRRDVTYRAFCEQASTVVAASRWVKRDLVELFGIDGGRIAVVNVPPPTSAYPEPDPDQLRTIRRDLGLPEKFVYYPAQTWPHKNHARLFQALGELRRSGLSIPLVCSGHRNEHHRAAVRAARDAGVAEAVTFLGFLTPLEIMVVYRSARALVFPSLYEGWGLPIVEAFRAGLPVACSNVTSLPELVADAAILMDPLDVGSIAEAIRELWTDDARAATLAGRGRLRAQCFSWAHVALTLRAHYRRVAGRRLEEPDRRLLAAGSVV